MFFACQAQRLRYSIDSSLRFCILGCRPLSYEKMAATTKAQGWMGWIFWRAAAWHHSPGGNCHAQGSAAQRGGHVDKFVSPHVRQRLMQKVRKP
jgi:hypothetical protein